MSKWFVTPVTELPAEMLPANLQWTPVIHGNMIVGLRNPAKGSFILHAMRDQDGKVKYFFPLHEDGPIGVDGRTTPGVVVVPCRKTEDGRIMVRTLLEWRPPILDPETGVRGVEIVGLSGGMAKKSGQTIAQTAIHEALTEAGLDLDELVHIYWASSNRAFGVTPIAYVIATVKGVTESAHEDLESIIGPGDEIPLDEFPLGLDGIVNTAIAFAWRHFNLVLPTNPDH